MTVGVSPCVIFLAVPFSGGLVTTHFCFRCRLCSGWRDCDEACFLFLPSWYAALLLQLRPKLWIQPFARFKNPKSFDGKIVRIKGTVVAGFDDFIVKDSEPCGYQVERNLAFLSPGDEGQGRPRAILQIQPAHNFAGTFTARLQDDNYAGQEQRLQAVRFPAIPNAQ